MMHTVGILHEHDRDDRKDHGVELKHQPTQKGVPLGHYDYSSLMHYCHIPDIVEFPTNQTLISSQALADRGDTFSAGDLNAIKYLYSFGGAHRGQWDGG
jgi:hypothetical protein